MTVPASVYDSVLRSPPRSLKPFFNPESVAVIGASDKKDKIGHVIFRNLLQPTFKGTAYPVNPTLDQILNHKCYPSVTDIPAHVDLAVIAVGSAFAVQIFNDLAKKRVPAAILISGGFREANPEGAKIEAEIKTIAHQNQIRLIGPNCVGVYDTNSRLDTVFLPEERCGRPARGHIALISQSGAIAGAIMDYATYQKVGISKIISIGNKADVNEADCLSYLKDDEDTKVICCYMEGLHPDEGPLFLRVAKMVNQIKPILMIKAGRTVSGTKAALSHTGSISGHDQIYDAAFKQAGLLRMENFEEMFDSTKIFTTQPLPKGPRVLVVTNAGGAAVLSIDACSSNGLEVPTLSKNTQQRLRGMMPPHVGVGNPIDLTGDTDSARYEKALETVFQTEEVDMALVILMVQVPLLGLDIVDKLAAIVKNIDKPMIVCNFGGEFTSMVGRRIEEKGIPTVPTPERAGRALANLYKRAKFLGEINR